MRRQRAGAMADDPKASEKLALLAHDLRTPLSAMRITAELIGQHVHKLKTERLGVSEIYT